MNDEFLFRYISFETFVGMVQNEALTFVLPSVWDDTQEETPFIQMVKKKESVIDRAFFIALHNKTYAQSWSELAESDAMWRIYAYNNRSVRIKVSKEKIGLLDNVNIVPVIYSDEQFDLETLNNQTFLSSLAYKRTAFCHEKEIRLISHYKYHDEEDATQHIKALLVINEHPKMIDILDSMFPNMEKEEQVNQLAELLNKGNKCQKIKDISYAHIPNFIDGVLVHPFAPDWYVDIVCEYCKRNNIPFEGKSRLYSDLTEV